MAAPDFREQNPYASPSEPIVRAEFAKPKPRNKWYWSYTVGLIGALCVLLLLPNGVEKTEAVVLVGIVAAGLWAWTRF